MFKQAWLVRCFVYEQKEKHLIIAKAEESAEILESCTSEFSTWEIRIVIMHEILVTKKLLQATFFYYVLLHVLSY